MNVVMTTSAACPVKNRPAAAMLFSNVVCAPEAWLLAPEFRVLTPNLQVSRTFSLPARICAPKKPQVAANKTVNKITK
jgi:hypothetical protein